MKRKFNVLLQNRKIFQLGISGHSKIYNWVFKSFIKLNQRIPTSSPHLRTRIEFEQNIKLTQLHSDNSPKMQIRLVFIQNLKQSQSISKIKEKNKIKVLGQIKLRQDVSQIHLKEEITGLINTPVKLKQNVNFSLIQLYKLIEWDYENSSDTSSKYFLSNLDDLTLDNMDVKSRIGG